MAVLKNYMNARGDLCAFNTISKYFLSGVFLHGLV